MHAVKNLTKQVVLIRLNSGIEINIAPEGRQDALAESEIRGNSVLEKLQALGVVAVGKSSTAGPLSASVETDRGELSTVAESDPDAKEDAPAKRPGFESGPKERGDTHPKHRK